MCKYATHHTPKLNFLLVLEQTQGLKQETLIDKNSPTPHYYGQGIKNYSIWTIYEVGKQEAAKYVTQLQDPHVYSALLKTRVLNLSLNL